MKHKITIQKRATDYIAYLNGDAMVCATGSSPCWALGRLVLSHATELGVELEQPVERAK